MPTGKMSQSFALTNEDIPTHKQGMGSPFKASAIPGSSQVYHKYPSINSSPTTCEANLSTCKAPGLLKNKPRLDLLRSTKGQALLKMETEACANDAIDAVLLLVVSTG